ncbi:MAG: SAM-dependent methyltransferase [Bacteroidetes bacterium]|nr:MAG: SAM-dependent methyltransferase [Bacteroidota bacterium]RLD77879.1 MAG: SAM-dependent methyltransferase [Bacteroidota bacterium]
MSEFWDERYAPEHYYYGKEPNAFFKSCIDNATAGKILLPGDGEGRNSVYAATQGWDVFAFDQSKNGRKKAMMLAEEKGVELDYRTGSILDFPTEPQSFDMIALIYFHLIPEARRIYHPYLVAALKPGGLLVMEVFGKDQINNNSGGPKDIDLLYSAADLMEDFKKLDIIQATEENIIFDESRRYQGTAAVVTFIGQKP